MTYYCYSLYLLCWETFQSLRKITTSCMHPIRDQTSKPTHVYKTEPYPSHLDKYSKQKFFDGECKPCPDCMYSLSVKHWETNRLVYNVPNCIILSHVTLSCSILHHLSPCDILNLVIYYSVLFEMTSILEDCDSFCFYKYATRTTLIYVNYATLSVYYLQTSIFIINTIEC